MKLKVLKKKGHNVLHTSVLTSQDLDAKRVSYGPITEGCPYSNNQVQYACFRSFDFVEGRIWENHKHEIDRGQVQVSRMCETLVF